MPRVESPPTRDLLRDSVGEAIAVCEGLLDEAVMSAVDAAVEELVRSLRNGGKVLLCGNGGSAADAQHLAAELIGRFFLDREALPAVALADNVAAMTAIGNDYSYDQVFARGVRGLGCVGDVLIGLSTSGHSANVVAALRAGQEMGLVTIVLVGRPDCPMADLATHTICVDGANTARIQEGQMVVGHTIFEAVERALCDGAESPRGPPSSTATARSTPRLLRASTSRRLPSFLSFRGSQRRFAGSTTLV